MKNLDDILNLITGNIAPERRKEVFSFLKEESKNKELYRKAKITWALMSSTQKMSDYEIEKSYRKLHSRISSKRGFRLILPLYFRYAAAIVLLVGVSATMFYLGRNDSLDFAAKLSYTSVVADKGQISKVILPDSSVVWLNSGTTLTFDNSFSFKNRNLNLTGQAFLEVKRNVKLPLIVAAGNLKVKVLGTRFDVKAYPDDNDVKVVLESGKVELLSAVDKSFKYQLEPGQLAKFEPQSRSLEIKEVESPKFSNWKDGELIFVDAPMNEVLKELERKFDIEIEVNNPDVYKSVFNANFKNESLKEVLEYIQFSCPITYRLIPGKDSKKAQIIINTK